MYYRASDAQADIIVTPRVIVKKNLEQPVDPFSLENRTRTLSLRLLID